MTPSRAIQSQGLTTGRVSNSRVLLWSAIVFGIAIGLRVLSCFESLWLDELHSTWTIWSDLSEVEPRARIGNQTPYYFWALYLWRQVFGDTEVALRMSSVFLLAGSCGLLTAGIYRVRRNLSLGILAGLILACEQNSIFFGTELRPYAAVVFLMTLLLVLINSPRRNLRTTREIAVVGRALLPVVSTGTGKSARPTNATLFLRAIPSRDHALLVILIAALFLVHLTAALTLGVLVIVFAFRHAKPADVSLAGLAIAIACLLEHGAIHDLWQRRQQWQAFAVPRPLDWETGWMSNLFGDFYAMWPWVPLVFIPLAALGVLRLIGNRVRLREWLPMLVVVVLVVLAAYTVSALEITALWHRRYIIGLLPVLAWTGAALWLEVARCVGRLFPHPGPIRRYANAGWIVTALLALTIWQGTLPQVIHRNWQLAQRGEEWRTAINRCRAVSSSNQPIAIYAGLIEGRMLEDRVSNEGEIPQRFLDYLCCPANNIYDLENVTPIKSFTAASIASHLKQRAEESTASKGQLLMIGRMSASRQRSFRHELDEQWEESVTAGTSGLHASGIETSFTPTYDLGVTTIQWSYRLLGKESR